MKIISLMTKSSSPSKVVNFLILVTFKIKDFEVDFFKVVVLQGYTQFFLMNIVHFSNKIYYWGPRAHNQLKKSIISYLWPSKSRISKVTTSNQWYFKVLLNLVLGIYFISMTMILLMTNSSSPTEVFNFLIPVTFQIKDFEGHYFKLVVLQGFT